MHPAPDDDPNTTQTDSTATSRPGRGPKLTDFLLNHPDYNQEARDRLQTVASAAEADNRPLAEQVNDANDTTLGRSKLIKEG